jgi:hypothetical protein
MNTVHHPQHICSLKLLNHLENLVHAGDSVFDSLEEPEEGTARTKA